MKTQCIVGLLAIGLTSLAHGAETSPQEAVVNAAKTLGQKPNYSWRTTTVVPESSPFRPGPWEGKADKEGLTFVSLTFGENTNHFVVKGDKAAATGQNGEWQSLSEMEASEGPGRFFAGMVRNFKAPAAQAAQLASSAKDLKKDGDVISGELTEEGASALLAWRPRSGGEGPKISGAQGSVKFWLKDGALTQYEFKVKGTVSFNGNDFENDRTTTVVIKDVGTTSLNIPDAAKSKLT
jgi:hypothetical protein